AFLLGERPARHERRGPEPDAHPERRHHPHARPGELADHHRHERILALERAGAATARLLLLGGARLAALATARLATARLTAARVAGAPGPLLGQHHLHRPGGHHVEPALDGQPPAERGRWRRGPAVRCEARGRRPGSGTLGGMSTPTENPGPRAGHARAGRRQLGRVGLWTGSLEGVRAAEIPDLLADLEAQGWPTLWFGEAVGREAFTAA